MLGQPNASTTTLERAFKLAEAGECKTVTEIKTILKTEGYDLTQLFGRTLNKQLQKLLTEKASKNST
jgi:hypothetical protein